MSILAAQLAASLNASLLQKKQQTESYLFTGKDADLDALHALASTAFTHLCSLSPVFESYDRLFSDAARALDRTLQTSQSNADLDQTINGFLAHLGPWLLEAPTSKALEWLVKRFRINEFNVPAVLSLFLPYHESPHFVKMLSILHVQPNATFSFLLAFKSAAKPLPRAVLIKAMASDSDLARFVLDLLPTAIKNAHSHRTLLAFHAATTHDYIATVPSLDDGILVFLLPSLLAPLQSSQKDPNATLTSFVLLCALSKKVNLTPAAVSAIINAMSIQVRGARSGKGSVSTIRFVKTAVAVCSSQGDVHDFPLSTCRLCTKMPGFADELSTVVTLVGAENFILPLLRPLADRIHENRVASLFSTLINTTNTPLLVVRELVRILVRLIALPPESAKVESETREDNLRVARSLLSLVHQRHLEILRDVADDVLADANSNPGDDKKQRKKMTSELLAALSLSHPLAESNDVNEVVVASASTSRETRMVAVEKIYSILRSTDVVLSATDMASIQSALLGRVYDTHVGVLQVLYDSPDLFFSTVASTTSPQQLLDVITSQLFPAHPARAILHAHVAFLAGPFVKTHPDCSSAVQQTALFPFLLASKAKSKTVRGVWEAIIQGGGFQTGWLRGCVDVWDQTEIDGESDEKLCDVNLSVADKIAENILGTDDYLQEIAVLLPKLHDPLPHARALAYLVCRALLARASGDQQISLAHRLMHEMRLSLLEAGEDASLQELLDARHVGMKVIIKPGGRNTIHALQASIIALISTLSAPRASFTGWISAIPSDAQTLSDRYVSLTRDVYALASATVPNQFSTSLLQTLFLQLRDNSLTFLLGALFSSTPSLESVRTHALLHGLAFIRAHSGDGSIDFQTVLPSLIVVLLDTRCDKRDRALIFECISLLGAPSEKKYMYGLDSLYGSASAQLQYVDTNDLSTYVMALVRHKEQLVQDADYIRVFHQIHFQGSNPKYRRRVLCFLLSHAINHPIPTARIALLRSIENVSDFSKSYMLLPLMKDLVQDRTPILQMFGTLSELYVSLVVAGFLDVSSSDLANQDDDEMWSVFVSGLGFYFHTNSDISGRELYADILEHRLFVDFDLEKRLEVCTILLQAGSEGGDVYLASRTLLGKLLEDVALISRLLVQFRPDHVECEAPVNKRAKLDQAPHTSEANKLPPLSLLAEVLGTTEIPGSLDLISSLLETLNRIVRSDLWGPSDTSYVCQMLMAAIEKSASKLEEAPVMPIRLDVLVELLRVTDNPQTFNEALILMANLARLTPDSVLHNIMPIFTFMGSNVFHRDDAYSFKVVQSTISNIVPVMASSLEKKHLDGLDLYVGARDFLRIFTDASNHIPRHRRQNFFVHLTEVLGAQAFLAPVCMLLVDKVTNRASRQTGEEAQNTLHLPISLLRHFERPRQLFVLIEVLKECLRLRSRLEDTDSVECAFLDYPRDGEHASSTSATLKRRIQALVLFVSMSLTASGSGELSAGEGGSITDIITFLLDLAAIPSGYTSENDFMAIVSAAQTAIEHIVNIISAREFLAASRVMLTCEDERIKAGALGVISVRIPLVTDEVREECQTMVVDLVGLIRDIMEHQSAGDLVESALGALKALGSTCRTGEEPALLSTLPHVLKVVRSRTSATAAVSVLPCFVTALGPRIIPHFRDVARECISILRETLKGTSQLAEAGEAALATLQSLLSSLPAFYGTTELRETAKLFIDYSASSSIQNNPLAGLTKAISKKVSAETLLPVLYDLWPDLDKAQTKESVNGMIGYFVLLKRALHAAPRPEVLDKLRPVFKVFLEAFDVEMAFGSLEGKSHVISAFTELVVKLNENAFRPLFRRMQDWAFVDDKATEERRITFCRVYAALLVYFKGLMNPYMSTLLRPLTETLQSFGSQTKVSSVLWSGVIGTLTKSLEADDGVFWREDKVATVLPHLLSQLPVAVRLPVSSEGRTPQEGLVACLVAVLVLLPHTASDLVKRLNLDLLMHTRSEDARVRILALECAAEMWKAEGGKLVGFVGDTAAFIVECAEDENDSVVREAHKLKSAVESVAGSIGGL